MVIQHNGVASCKLLLAIIPRLAPHGLKGHARYAGLRVELLKLADEFKEVTHLRKTLRF